MSVNVAALVQGPRVPYSEHRPLTDAQTRRLLETVQGDRLEALYILAVYTGMREGELLGLRWQDVDLEGAQVHVRKSLSRNELTDVKTERSRRTLPLPGPALTALRDHQRRQMAERVDNPRRVEQGLVFAGPLGSPLDGSRMARILRGHLAAAGLPTVRFHDLRHGWATMALAAGVPMRVISDQLGHATTTVTQNVYSHLTEGALGDAARRLEERLG